MPSTAPLPLRGIPDSATSRFLVYDYTGRKARAVYDSLDTFYLSLAASFYFKGYRLTLFLAHALWNLIPSRPCRSSGLTIFPHSPQTIGCRFIHRSLIFSRHTEQKVLSFCAFLLHETQSPRRLCRPWYRFFRSCCVIPLHSATT